MQKIKDFIKERKVQFFCFLALGVTIIFGTLVGNGVACIIEYQANKKLQRLQHCMYKNPQNTVEECELLLDFKTQ